MDYLGALDHNLFLKLCYGVHEAGNGHGFRVHKVEPILGEWAIRSPLFYFGTVKNSPGFVQIGPKSSMCCVHELCGNCVSSSELTLMLLIKIE